MDEKREKEQSSNEEVLELEEVDLKPPVPPKKDYKVEEDTGRKGEKGLGKTWSSLSRPEVIYPPERIETWMTCLKCTLVAFNLVIWVLGTAVMAVGIWIELDKEFWTIQTNLDMKLFSHAGYIIIAVGAVIMVIGLCGCYGAVRESLCTLAVYAIIVFILIFLEAAAMGIVWSATSNEKTKEDIKLRIRTAMGNREENVAMNYFLDLLQAKLKCCGVVSSSEYSEKETPSPLPASCTDEDTGRAFEKGCIDAALDYLKSKAAIIGGISITILLLQLGALVLTLCLFCGVRQSTKNVF